MSNNKDSIKRTHFDNEAEVIKIPSDSEFIRQALKELTYDSDDLRNKAFYKLSPLISEIRCSEINNNYSERAESQLATKAPLFSEYEKFIIQIHTSLLAIKELISAVETMDN